MAALIDVLANLCRKNFGVNVIGTARDLRFVGLTFDQAYALEEDSKPEARTSGDFGSEGGEHGEIIVFRVNPDGSKPSRWLAERTLPNGEPF